MKITSLEILKVPPSWVWLKIHTDDGLYGLGEPYLEGHPDSVIAEVRRFGSPAARASAHREPDARATFLRRHRREIDNSFSVAGAVVADSVAVGLVRYSIGPSVYHDVRWLRRVDGAWYPTDPPASNPSDTGVAVDSLGPAAARWLKEGDPRWW